MPKRKCKEITPPLAKETRDLMTVFLKAAETGKRDQFSRASKAAYVFDQMHGTDYVVQLSSIIGCGKKHIKRGFDFTKANGYKIPAIKAFRSLAENMNVTNSNYRNPARDNSQVYKNIPVPLRQ